MLRVYYHRRRWCKAKEVYFRATYFTFEKDVVVLAHFFVVVSSSCIALATSKGAPIDHPQCKVDETMGLIPNLEFMRINTKSPKFS